MKRLQGAKIMYDNGELESLYPVESKIEFKNHIN